MDNFSIRISNLTKKFNDFVAVDNLSLQVQEGEIFAFLGPNGAGKTTTVKLLCGLLRPTSGQIEVCGYSAAGNLLNIKQIIGLVPDHPFIYPKLTGTEFLQLVANTYKVDKKEQSAKIPEYMKMFELEDFANEMVETYSLGMRQKLIIASMLIHNPKVVFLDEPLVGLDPKSARLVKEIFMELRNRKVTIFICTHILEIAEKLATKIGIIHKGKMLALGTKDELRNMINSRHSNLEDIYLDLTGGFEYAELLKYL